ncbi:MAG: radical SAM protein [Planctomycetota bacterium]|nr:radical SAM protein [Planctomycetota bacterium]
MTRVTFLEPPAVTERNPERFAGCTYELYHFPDLGNLYAFTMLHERGVEVDYLDASLLGDDAAAFERRLAERPADWYVLHAVVLAKPTDLHWIAALRRLQPAARIVVHGPEATRVPAEYLTVGGALDPQVIVVRGEMERALVDLVLGQMPSPPYGVSRVEGAEVKTYAPDPRGYIPFDDLPIPARDHPALDRYRDRYFNPKYQGRPHALVLTSRGCSFRCSFCVPNAISFAREMEAFATTGRKPPVAQASPERIAREFQWLKDRGYRSVHVADDQFLWARKRTLEICRLLAPIGMEWGMLSRADFLTDEEVVAALARAGCVSIDIGVESLRQEVLDRINKDLKVEDVYSAVRLLRKHGISPKLNIMFGTTPDETPEDVYWTVAELKKLDITNVMFAIATPFKGTAFYDHCRDNGYLIDESDDLNPMGKAMISYPGLTGAQLEELERYAYRSFYLRPKVVVDRLRRARTVKDLVQDLRVAARVLLH